MKIRINRQKFLKAECPQVPKNVWFKYYYEFFQLVRNYPVKITELITIDIRINISYTGSNKFHFYTSINGGPETYTNYYSHEMPQYMFNFELKQHVFKKQQKEPKGDFLLTLQNIDKINVNCDTSKIQAQKDLYWNTYKLKKDSKKHVKLLKNEYLTYLRLKTQFDYENK